MGSNERCDRPPAGWFCTRGAGHDGPCAAVQEREAGLREAKAHLAEICDALSKMVGTGRFFGRAYEVETDWLRRLTQVETFVGTLDLADVPSAGVLVWSDAPPDRAGWWWFRELIGDPEYGFHSPQIVAVVKRRLDLKVCVYGQDFAPDAFPGCQWAGPIREPVAAGPEAEVAAALAAGALPCDGSGSLADVARSVANRLLLGFATLGPLQLRGLGHELRAAALSAAASPEAADDEVRRILAALMTIHETEAAETARLRADNDRLREQRRLLTEVVSVATGALCDPILADADAKRPRPRSEWHEDVGSVLWWSFPVEEEPYVGSPLDSGWPGDEFYTHWTPLVCPEEPATTAAAKAVEESP